MPGAQTAMSIEGWRSLAVRFSSERNQQCRIDEAQLHLGSSFRCNDPVTRTRSVELPRESATTHNPAARQYNGWAWSAHRLRHCETLSWAPPTAHETRIGRIDLHAGEGQGLIRLADIARLASSSPRRNPGGKPTRSQYSGAAPSVVL
jgi:hypothetical protein